MSLIKNILKKNEKRDFLFPNNFDELMNNDYYDYDKFEWFLYHVFDLDDGCERVEKIGRKGKGDGGADLILTIANSDGSQRRIGIQAKYWKNRVGTAPINQLASARSRLGLTDLWIVTTSDLTSDAQQIAESMGIKILRKEDVEIFIESVKQMYTKDITEKRESEIAFIDVKKYPAKIKTSNTTDLSFTKMLRKERIKIAKYNKISPVYLVYDDKTIAEIISKKPTTLEELIEVRGFDAKKVEKFGFYLVNRIRAHLNMEAFSNQKEEPEIDVKEFTAFLKESRKKIATYNNIDKLYNVFNNKTLEEIIEKQPRTKEELLLITGIGPEKMELWGSYLLKEIKKFLDK